MSKQILKACENIELIQDIIETVSSFSSDLNEHELKQLNELAEIAIILAKESQDSLIGFIEGISNRAKELVNVFQKLIKRKQTKPQGRNENKKKRDTAIQKKFYQLTSERGFKKKEALNLLSKEYHLAPETIRSYIKRH